MPVAFLPEFPLYFPHPSQADRHGLLAIGGSLSSERIILAYQNGIFPWYNLGEPIMWWSLSPRLMLDPKQIHVSKSMHRVLNNKSFSVTADKDFEQVMRNCGTIMRQGQNESWIHEEMIQAYINLHQMGIAHSIEVWKSEELVGGIYGLAIGKLFCGESMFSKIPNTSKLAMINLANFLSLKKFDWIDCQQESDHMKRMGASVISQGDFLNYLEQNKRNSLVSENWSEEFSNFYQEWTNFRY